MLVIYDITDDNLRNKVANVLMAYGLVRVQKSAFLGKLTSEQLKDLRARIQRMIKGERANIQFYPLCPHCYIRRQEIGVPTVERPLIARGAIVLV